MRCYLRVPLPKKTVCNSEYSFCRKMSPSFSVRFESQRTYICFYSLFSVSVSDLLFHPRSFDKTKIYLSSKSSMTSRNHSGYYLTVG